MLEGCVAKVVFFFFLSKLALSWGYDTTVASHGTTAGDGLPCACTAASQAWYYRFHRGSNFLLPLKERYYCPARGTSARAVLPRHREQVGVKSGQGEFQLPHTHSTQFPPTSSLSISPAQERRRRTLTNLRLRPLSSHSDRWDRSPPRPLAMDPGISPCPSRFVPFLSF